MKRYAKKSPQRKEPAKKDPTPLKFVLDKVLGEGSFARAYLLKDKSEVLRIALLSFDNENDSPIMVKRGLEILHIFQSFTHLLGPSLLVEISPYRIVNLANPDDDINNYIEGGIPKGMENTSIYDEYALQHIELLAGGYFHYTAYVKLKMTENEIRFSIFSLIWFFAAGQQYFDYRHHDLKSSNILIRHTPERKIYGFKIGESYYHFESHIVPVVTDYDYASVKTTEDDKNFPGTRFTSPPDALLYLLGNNNKGWEDYPARFEYNEDSYDYWSLGICIFELLSPYAVHVLFESRGYSFATEVFNLHPTLPNTSSNSELLKDIFFGICFASIVSDTPFKTLKPPLTHFPAFRFLDWSMFNKSVFQHEEYKVMVKLFNEKFPSDLKPLVKRLLNWDSSVRNADNFPMRIILEESKGYFKPEKKAQKNIDYSYEGFDIKILQTKKYLPDINTRDHPLLKNRLCEGCLGKTETMYLCSCCAKPFCGKDCQRKKH